MITRKINLKKYYPNLKHDLPLESFIPINFKEIDLKRTRPAILVIPGGGYDFVSQREAEPIALRFLGYDIATFVLTYSVSPLTVHPYPLVEGLVAIDYIRKHAKKFNIDPNQIYVMGFSAGGHLAASLAAHYDKKIAETELNMKLDSTVNGAILCYPVLSMADGVTHNRTRENITCKDPATLKEFYSIDKQVTPKFPRTFIFHCVDDNVVPVENTNLLVEALKKNNVEYECHIYAGGIHGSSLGDRTVYSDNIDIDCIKESQEWPQKAVAFIRRK